SSDLDGGTALLRDALRVLVQDLDLAPEHAAALVENLLGQREAVADLLALGHRAGRRHRDGSADLDRILRAGCKGPGHRDGDECQQQAASCSQGGPEARLQSATHRGKYSRKNASRSVDSTHTLLATPVKTSVRTSRSRSSASRFVE